MCIRDRNKEVVFADVTFNKERQKADVSVVKQDKDTKKQLNGGIFALYASDDIKNADGTVAVSYTHLKRNFVDDGMCAQFAIHDSENPNTHQRNLHCHIMLTMRPVSYTHLDVYKRQALC